MENRDPLPSLQEALKKWAPPLNGHQFTVRSLAQVLITSCHGIARTKGKPVSFVLAATSHLGLRDWQCSDGMSARRRRWQELEDRGSLVEIRAMSQQRFWAFTRNESLVCDSRQRKIILPEKDLGQMSQLRDIFGITFNRIAEVCILLGLTRDEGQIREDFQEIIQDEAISFHHWLADY